MGRAIWGLLAVLAALGVCAPAAQATLSVPMGGSPATFRGSGASAATALASFEAAIGGRDNGTTAGEQSNGFRHLTWDTLAVDGSDPTSRTIESGHVVGLGDGRLEPWGIDQGPSIAVANDGFASANPSTTFTPFTQPNVWAPYNTNTAELDVVAPAAAGSVPVPAQTRGLGVVLLNVTTSDTTVQYYNGDILLGQVVPLMNGGGPSFAGLLFPNAVVTRVVITLGTAQIFDFDGGTVSPTTPGPDFVAGDDVALAEPTPARGAVAASAGVPVTSALDTFTETNPNATITAVIDWGDGTRTPGTITPGSDGTFVVTGNHAYLQTGSYTAQVTVDDFGGPEQTKQTDIVVGSRGTTTAMTCSPSPVTVSAGTRMHRHRCGYGRHRRERAHRPRDVQHADPGRVVRAGWGMHARADGHRRRVGVCGPVRPGTAAPDPGPASRPRTAATARTPGATWGRRSESARSGARCRC